MAPTARFVVHLRLGGVLVAAERAAMPSLAGLPVAVGATPRSRGLVVAVSPEARHAGVEAGMPAAEAAAAAPEVIFLAGRLDRHLDFAAELDAIVRRYAGGVCWSGLDEAVFTVAEASRLRGLVEALRADLAALDLEVACGIAASRFPAMVASWLVAPNGVLQVRPGYEREFLGPVAIEAIESMAPEVVARARQRGWSRLADVASLLPEVALEAFGGRGIVWQRWCAGQDADAGGPLAAPVPSPPARLVERLNPAPLAPWPNDAGSLARVVADALCRLQARAAAIGCTATIATLRLEHDDGRADARRVVLPLAGDGLGADREATTLTAGLVPDVASQVAVALAGLRASRRAHPRPRSRRFTLLGKLSAVSPWQSASAPAPGERPHRVRSA